MSDFRLPDVRDKSTYLMCTICGKPIRTMRGQPTLTAHKQCVRRAAKKRSKTNCTVCGKPYTPYKNSRPGATAHFRCAPYVVSATLTGVQEDCLAREGMCWRTPFLSPCVHGLSMDHTNCRVREGLNFSLPPSPPNWDAYWSAVTGIYAYLETLEDHPETDLLVRRLKLEAEYRRELLHVLAQEGVKHEP